MMTPIPTGASLHLASCVNCGLVSRLEHSARSIRHFCSRCGGRIHLRKPDSLTRSWAYLIAAAILYIPANLMTILHTRELLDDEKHTILGGIIELWQNDAWDLAIIVFVASIMVPMIKLFALTILLIAARSRDHWRAHQRTRLHRMLEIIGHWSMLDVFVVALLVALVQLRAFAEVHAGPAAMAFGAVVVLTMLASKSFDSRLIWDTREYHD